jgi:putative addiction module killer protein
MLEVLKSAPFEAWFSSLRDRRAQARINARIRRLSLGNSGDVKPVGSGVSELRIDYGPGVSRLFYATRPHFLPFCCARRQTNSARGHQAGDQDCEGLERVMYGH